MLIFHLRQLYQRKNKTEVLSFIEPVPQNTKRFDTLPTQTKSIPLPSKPKTVPSLSTPEKSKPSSRLKTSHVMTGKDTKSVIALMKRVQIFTSLFGGMFLDVIFLMHKNGHLQFICWSRLLQVWHMALSKSHMQHLLFFFYSLGLLLVQLLQSTWYQYFTYLPTYYWFLVWNHLN